MVKTKGLIALYVAIAFAMLMLNSTLNGPDAPAESSVVFYPDATAVLSCTEQMVLGFDYNADGPGLPPGTSFRVNVPPYKGGLYGILRGEGITYAIDGKDGDVSFAIDNCVSGEHGQGFFGAYQFTLPTGLASGKTLSIRIPWKIINPFHPYYGPDQPPATRLTVTMLHPDGTKKVLDSPQWKVATEPAERLNLLCPSQAAVGEQVTCVLNETNFLGRPSFDNLGTVAISAPKCADIAEGNRLELTPEKHGVIHFSVSFSEPGVHRLAAKAGNGFEARGNPIRVGGEEPPVYWGNLHTHSTYSWDQRSWAISTLNAAQTVATARKLFLLDFIGISDHHDEVIPRLTQGLCAEYAAGKIPKLDMRSKNILRDIPRATWEQYAKEILGASSKDIVAYVGFEHTDRRGDKVMTFRHKAPYPFDGNARMLYKDFEDKAPAGDMICGPHLVPFVDATLYADAPTMERLLEIFDFHGIMEYFGNEQPQAAQFKKRFRRDIFPWNKNRSASNATVRGLLDKGRRSGISASEDHGTPGQSGVTAVRAPEKERNAIFDALLSRHTYATTGARMLMEFSLGALQGGDERVVSAADPLALKRALHIELHATAPIETIQIIRNGKIMAQRVFDGDVLDWSGEIVDNDPLESIFVQREFGGEKTAYYYLRVLQKDGHLGFSSPIFLLHPQSGV